MIQKILKIFAVFCFLVITVAGCEFNGSEGSSSKGNSESGDSNSKYTVLTVDKWTSGEIVKLKNDKVDEQWFKFVATASMQRIYVKFSTMNCISATLYDTSFNPVGNNLNTSGDASTTAYVEKNVTTGLTYYIKVTSGEYRYDGRRDYTGKYWIGVTDFPAQPETVITDLSNDKWTDGKIESESNGGTGEQWFKFIATAAAQRVYVKFNTMNCISATLYDSSLNPVGNNLNTSGDASTTAYVEKTVTSGLTYYIKVTSGEYRYDGRRDYTGTYWIGFTDFPAQPETVITDLTENNWVNGKIETESNGGTGEQWFKFVATASAQRIYVKFNTMNCIAATLYDDSYNIVGSALDASGDANKTTYVEKTVTSGKTYYIKVTEGNYHYDGRSSYTGTYWITFNSTGTEPQ